jgi:hypothetical protein
VQLRILLGRQFAAGEDDDRNVRDRVVLADLLQHVEAGHVRQAQIEHDAIAVLFPQGLERVLAGSGRDDLDVVVT